MYIQMQSLIQQLWGGAWESVYISNELSGDSHAFGSNIATQVSSSDQEHASVGCQFRLLLLINPVEVAPSCYFAKTPKHTY